ncbi:MAG: hypothetical protein OEV42_10115 [Deltaproteobacteria bacterium]|nr:hypothetical protein [Deltaproteobacteria bacterium]
MAVISALMRTVSPLAIRRLPLIVGIVFSLQANCTYAAQTFIGVSTKWVHLKGKERSTGYEVVDMTGDTDQGLVLAVKSMDNYFANSSFGYFIELGIDSYAVDRNVTSGSEVVHTKLEGYYLYLTPTLFYSLFKGNPNDWSLKMGAGLGIGYITADGLVKMDEGPGLPARSIDGKDHDISFGIIMEYTYKNWVIQAKEYTPGATIDGIDFKIELPSVIVAYKFDL